EMEIVGEIEGRDVVEGEFHAETGGIYKEERPNAPVAKSRGEGAGSLPGWPGALTVDRVFSELVINDAGGEHDHGRNDHRRAPTREEGEKERHRDLGDASAEIAPSRDNRVCASHHIRREHHGRVVLRDHERRADAADGEAECEKPGV